MGERKWEEQNRQERARKKSLLVNVKIKKTIICADDTVIIANDMKDVSKIMERIYVSSNDYVWI